MNPAGIMKNVAAHLGFHVARIHQDPKHTLLGLKQLNFGTILDVGANTGQFARSFGPNFPEAEFHCFEPTPAAFEALSGWAQNMRSVTAVNLALGEMPDTLDMNLHTDHNQSSSLLATTTLTETLFKFTTSQIPVRVRVERLDDYVARLASPLSGEILLKLDVQGYEVQVLRGAVDVLKRVRAAIVEVLIDQLYVEQSRFADIVAIMDAAGLNYAGNFDQVYASDGRVMWLDAVFLRNSTTSSFQ